MVKTSNKIHDIDSIIAQVSDWKQKGLKVVFTNGCFDILHRGHVDYLEKSRALGDVLIVAANSDESVKNLKGPERPINDEHSRLLILASLQFVDAVTLFSGQTPIDVISAVQPDVLVKGNDYLAGITDQKDPKYIVGSDIVRENGGEVKTVELVKGFSTSTIIDKIIRTNN